MYAWIDSPTRSFTHSNHILRRVSCTCLSGQVVPGLCTSPKVLHVPLARWNFPSDRSRAVGPARSARQCGDEPSCQRFPDPHARNGPWKACPSPAASALSAILPVILDASPAQDRILQPPRAREQLAVGRYPEAPGAAPIGLGHPAVCEYQLSDRPTCLSSTCGLGAIKRFRRAPRRQVRRPATAKQAVFCLVRSEQLRFPFFLRPGNLTGRVVPSVIQYRK